VAQHRQAAVAARPAWQNCATRFLDLWLHQLHPHLPDLKKLERKYPNELVVISVHSAKFEHESKSENIRNAVIRYNIEHPVLVDQNMQVWSAFGVNAWPTFVLLDPSGRVVGQVAGEGNYDILDKTMARWRTPSVAPVS
jgi:thiol-disulfide isomerase/thioredoxin